MMLLLGKIWQVLSLKFRGLGLLMGSVTKASFRLMKKRRDKSSMYFRCNERGLGTAGRRRPPLNMIMNSKMLKKVP